MPPIKKIEPKNWLFVAIISLVLFFGFFYFITVASKKIVISLPVYFFLIIVIDFAATAFLSGAMKSVARYQVKSDNKSLYLAGPAVIFFIILYIGYKYRPEPPSQPVSISVLVTDDKNALIKNGKVHIRVGLVQNAADLDSNGVAFFSGIIGDYKGSDVDIYTEVPGYHMDKQLHYKVSDLADFTNIKIPLIKNIDSISIQGHLTELPSRTAISHALVTFEGVKSLFETDSLGSFSAVLPFKSGTEVRVIVLKGHKEIYNSLRTLTDHSFLDISPN